MFLGFIKKIIATRAYFIWLEGNFACEILSDFAPDVTVFGRVV